MSEQEEPQPESTPRERENSGDIKPPTKGDIEPPPDGEQPAADPAP